MPSQDFPGRYAKIATRHAAIALLWQASDASEYGGNGYPISDDDHGRVVVDDDFDYIDAVIPLISEAVTAFVRDNFELLTSAKVRAAQCGHDLVLTANRHGTGFWDRGLGAAGEVLTEATRGYSFDAEFELFGEERATDDHCADELAWLMVENEVLVDHIGASAEA
jgi:hypothetical protein